MMHASLSASMNSEAHSSHLQEGGVMNSSSQGEDKENNLPRKDKESNPPPLESLIEASEDSLKHQLDGTLPPSPPLAKKQYSVGSSVC